MKIQGIFEDFVTLSGFDHTIHMAYHHFIYDGHDSVYEYPVFRQAFRAMPQNP